MQRLLDVTQGSRRPLDTTKGYLGIGLAAAEVGTGFVFFWEGGFCMPEDLEIMGTMNS